jgi:lipopolysaccharide/colanic/teichoic acid biosynthesis glycosyltransferase
MYKFRTMQVNAEPDGRPGWASKAGSAGDPHLVKPGITGWAQVNQAYECCIDDVRSKVHYDLEYGRRHSVVEDLRIISMRLPDSLQAAL